MKNTVKKIKERLKDAESALVWYACACPNLKKKLTENGNPSSRVADRYFDKHGFDENKVRVIK